MSKRRSTDIEKRQIVGFIVIKSYTAAVEPLAVVVHFENTGSTLSAVVSPLGLVSPAAGAIEDSWVLKDFLFGFFQMMVRVQHELCQYPF